MQTLIQRPHKSVLVFLLSALDLMRSPLTLKKVLVNELKLKTIGLGYSATSVAQTVSILLHFIGR